MIKSKIYILPSILLVLSNSGYSQENIDTNKFAMSASFDGTPIIGGKIILKDGLTLSTGLMWEIEKRNTKEAGQSSDNSWESKSYSIFTGLRKYTSNINKLNVFYFSTLSLSYNKGKYEYKDIFGDVDKSSTESFGAGLSGGLGIEYFIEKNISIESTFGAIIYYRDQLGSGKDSNFIFNSLTSAIGGNYYF